MKNQCFSKNTLSKRKELKHKQKKENRQNYYFCHLNRRCFVKYLKIIYCKYKNKMKNNILEIVFIDEEVQILTDLAKYITINPIKNTELYCHQVKNLCEHIPERIKTYLDNFKKNNKYSCILFKNFPIDLQKIVSTPSTNHDSVGSTTLFSKIQAILVSYISDIIAYEGECSGYLFQDIVPIESMSKEQVSVGSSIELEIHTEQAFSKLKPDLLSLACLRSNRDAFTYILPVKHILHHISKETHDLLLKPLWNFGIDLSFKINNNEFIDGDIRGPFPILQYHNNVPYLLFDQNLITGITPEANMIIKELIEIYYNYRLKYCLQSGDILIINNNIAVHGRSPFKAQYDGNDRFLVRCFGTYDLDKSLYARTHNSRVIEAIYS